MLKVYKVVKNTLEQSIKLYLSFFLAELVLTLHLDKEIPLLSFCDKARLNVIQISELNNS